MEKNKYWSNRYLENSTGWDIGYPSTPLKEYIDQLADKEIKILIPGAGNAYEAEYLWKKGFTNVFILDVSEIPLDNFKKRNPGFPNAQLVFQDFFEHDGQYDLIVEQTFFCSFEPTDENRFAYAKHMSELLKPKGKLVGVWFDIPLDQDNMEKRPFGGTKEMYLNYLQKHLEPVVFERCYNSIKPRQGNELFGIWKLPA